MRVLLQLLWSFIKIGFTSFGGLSMIPLITSEMMSHGWMTFEEVSDIIAIAEMTPGPVGLNSSTFAGIRTAGIPGALFAAAGVLLPSLSLGLLAAVFLEKFRSSSILEKAMIGVRPASVGLVAGVAVTMGISNYLPGGIVSIPSVAIGLLDAFLLIKMKLSIPKTIILSAVLGLVLFGVMHM